MSDETKLKPCPFCGGTAYVGTMTLDQKPYYGIGCATISCRGTSISGGDDLAKESERWNRRAQPASKTPAVKS